MLYAKHQILSGNNSKNWLTHSVTGLVSTVDICTAYLKTDALEQIWNSFLLSGYKGKSRILVRWKLCDLLVGASDLSAYEFSKNHAIDFYINQSFHGKLYRVSNCGILLGSANLTNSGFGFRGEESNEECCVVFDESTYNNSYIKNLFDESVKLDNYLYNQIKDYLETSDGKNTEQLEWPDDIELALNRLEPPNNLFVDDLFFTDNPLKVLDCDTEDVHHDLSLLGVKNPSLISITHSFSKSTAFRWLQSAVTESGGEIYFGKLASLLHATLLNDPAPYRNDVKRLLSNLLAWSSMLCPEFILVDRPQHSQRIRSISQY